MSTEQRNTARVRHRLIELVDNAARHKVVAVGGTGWGKTHLANAVVAAHRGCVVEIDGASTVASLREHTRNALGEWENARQLADQLAGSKAVLAADRLDLGSPDIVMLLAEVAEHLRTESADGGMVFATARLRSAPSTDSPVVTMNDLAFTSDEIADLLDERVGTNEISPSLVLDITGGWPAAVDACVSYLAQARTDLDAAVKQLVRRAMPVNQLLSESESRLDESDLETLSVLARMSVFNDAVATAAADAEIATRAIVHGMPIDRDSGGWMRILEPHATHFARRQIIAPSSVRDLIEPLIGEARIAEALSSCLALGAHDEAARIIAQLSIDEALTAEPDRLVAALTTIGDAALEHPRCMQVTAQCLAIAGRSVEGMPLLERAEMHLNVVDPGIENPRHLELLTELGVWQLLLGRGEQAINTLRRCEIALPEDDRGLLRARLLDLRGLLHAQDNERAGLLLARADMTEALALWRQLGDARAAVLTGLRLSNNVLVGLGRRDEALALLDSLGQMSNISMLDRGRVALFSGMMLPFVGRSNEVAKRVTLARELGSMLDMQWMIWWADWAEAVAASTLRDAVRVQELATGLEVADAVMTSPAATATMWSELAEAAARCSLNELAWRYLDRATSLDALDDVVLDYFDASVTARIGDPAVARKKLESYRSHPKAETERSWFVELLLALTHHRVGNLDDAAKHRAMAYQHSGDLGQSRLPAFVESAVIEELGAAVPASRSPGRDPAPTPTDELAHPPVVVHVFESFEVRAGDEPLQVPGGRATSLLKLLVVNRGAILVDQAIDVMWPDADLELGRRRLRNVVLRVRQVCGEVLERNGDSISLAPHVETDFEVAHRLAARAANPDTSMQVIRQAAELWRRPLLADDRYEDWADEARREQITVRRAILQELIHRAETAGHATAMLVSELDALDEY